MAADEKLSQLTDLPLPIQDLDLFYTVRTTSTSTNTATGFFKVTWIEIKDEAIDDTAVTPGSYGNSTHVGAFTVNQQGQITAASNVVISGGGGGGSTPSSYNVADTVFARSLVTHVAANFTTGVHFVAIDVATITGFKFAYDGFASKTVKWTLYNTGLDGSGSTVIQTSTIAVAAAGVYTVTLASPLVFSVGTQYTIALYINDGTNLIDYTTHLPGWLVLSVGNSQREVIVGPIIWLDIAVFAAGDAKPVGGNGTNNSPIQLTYQ